MALRTAGSHPSRMICPPALVHPKPQHIALSPCRAGELEGNADKPDNAFTQNTGQQGIEDFHGDAAAEILLEGRVHGAHAATAEERAEAIAATDDGAGEIGRGGHERLASSSSCAWIV